MKVHSEPKAHQAGELLIETRMTWQEKNGTPGVTDTDGTYATKKVTTWNGLTKC